MAAGIQVRVSAGREAGVKVLKAVCEKVVANVTVVSAAIVRGRL